MECRAAGRGVRVVIGGYEGVVLVPRRVFQRLLQERPTPERCVEAYYLQRTRFERVAERKLRRRQLAEDGNVEITGRDLREGWPEGSSRTGRLYGDGQPGRRDLGDTIGQGTGHTQQSRRDANQRHSLWHEYPDLGGSPHDGIRPDAAPNGTSWPALVPV